MKCFYKHCKLGGNVEKDVAIKYNTKYYHKECYKKKINKEKSALLLKQKGFVVKTINMALMTIIDKDDFDSDLVYFTIKYVIENKKDLNNPFGVKYYLQNFEINDKYKKYKRFKQIEENKNKKVEIEDVEEVKFNYVKKKPKYLNIIKKE
jgi:hypothetical protein